EMLSLCSLVDALDEHFSLHPYQENGQQDLTEQGSGSAAPSGYRAEWIRCLDGFYFSYTIEHISKEFDLLKLSADAGCVLNIELKSEAVEEERIRKQLEQNRYYLSHISRTILSYTYVMETDTLYYCNDRGFLRECGIDELARALRRPALQDYIGENIRECFRAQDYLISPVKNPEKFLTGRYFLTNQQFDFRRQILETFQDYEKSLKEIKDFREPEGPDHSEEAPVVSLTGGAGTGKTLLMLDLAVELSRKKRVMFLHGGPLREGHREIDRRLHKVSIQSGTDWTLSVPQDSGALAVLRDYSFLLVDEANRLPSETIVRLIEAAASLRIPAVFSYDPHTILGAIPRMEDAEAVIAAHETMQLELSGNIRINRPIYSFLRALFYQKDAAPHSDYSCIDILYASDRHEEQLLTSYCRARGYKLIPENSDSFRSGEIISQEFDKVLMVLDSRFYYDETLRLCADSSADMALPLLYEGLSRAKERLCLLVVGNKTLFEQLLAIRLLCLPGTEIYQSQPE
ncbi:MAG: ATP-binding protein, partial [Lachnospiraceae bacterium]|nr:ATP-binding protein [Lachnospiraceae bacterium]